MNYLLRIFRKEAENAPIPNSRFYFGLGVTGIRLVIALHYLNLLNTHSLIVKSRIGFAKYKVNILSTWEGMSSCLNEYLLLNLKFVLISTLLAALNYYLMLSLKRNKTVLFFILLEAILLLLWGMFFCRFGGGLCDIEHYRDFILNYRPSP